MIPGGTPKLVKRNKIIFKKVQIIKKQLGQLNRIIEKVK